MSTSDTNFGEKKYFFLIYMPIRVFNFIYTGSHETEHTRPLHRQLETLETNNFFFKTSENSQKTPAVQ